MFGKIFESLYEGSMIGAGSPVFAVWGYVIAKMRLDETVGAQVELNPALLSFVLGEQIGKVQDAIDYLCAPDPKSRSKEEGGRRLVKIGQFAYRVVNGRKYHSIKKAEERREYMRVAQARHREKKKSKEQVKAENDSRERRYVEAEQNGDNALADAIAAEGT